MRYQSAREMLADLKRLKRDTRVRADAAAWRRPVRRLGAGRPRRRRDVRAIRSGLWRRRRASDSLPLAFAAGGHRRHRVPRVIRRSANHDRRFAEGRARDRRLAPVLRHVATHGQDVGRLRWPKWP